MTARGRLHLQALASLGAGVVLLAALPSCARHASPQAPQASWVNAPPGQAPAAGPPPMQPWFAQFQPPPAAPGFALPPPVAAPPVAAPPVAAPPIAAPAESPAPEVEPGGEASTGLALETDFGQSLPTRKHGNLTIPEQRVARGPVDRDVIKADTIGTFLATEPRIWVGAPVPGYVAPGFDAFELSQLIPIKDGDLALYRTFFGDAVQGHCPSDGGANCRYRARVYAHDGSLRSEIDLNGLMPSDRNLRVSELTVADGVLYFAQACQSYSKEAGGRCSDVVAVDMRRPALEVLWRSKFLVSNGPILVIGDYLVTGYGFTSEPDFVHVLDRKTGKVLHRTRVAAAPTGFEVKDDALSVFLYGKEQPQRFQLVRFFPTTNGKGKVLPPSPSLTTFK
ncbi:MAG: hypothetical protein FJ096_09510 [Deltaproteobacteria bacterium]|nr:hypothetical protein [Deltaproteobacteria bacterium]